MQCRVKSNSNPCYGSIVPEQTEITTPFIITIASSFRKMLTKGRTVTNQFPLYIVQRFRSPGTYTELNRFQFVVRPPRFHNHHSDLRKLLLLQNRPEVNISGSVRFGQNK